MSHPTRIQLQIIAHLEMVLQKEVDKLQVKLNSRLFQIIQLEMDGFLSEHDSSIQQCQSELLEYECKPDKSINSISRFYSKPEPRKETIQCKQQTITNICKPGINLKRIKLG